VVTARTPRAVRINLDIVLHPAEHAARDAALFALGGLAVFTFDREAVAKLAGGFGWRGALTDVGLDPDRAFARHYLNGSIVVAAWRGPQGGRPC
jgi:hypothetical protein